MKLHTLLDLRGSIRPYRDSDAKYDVNVLDLLISGRRLIGQDRVYRSDVQQLIDQFGGASSSRAQGKIVDEIERVLVSCAIQR